MRTLIILFLFLLLNACSEKKTSHNSSSLFMSNTIDILDGIVIENVDLDHEPLYKVIEFVRLMVLSDLIQDSENSIQIDFINRCVENPTFTFSGRRVKVTELLEEIEQSGVATIHYTERAIIFDDSNKGNNPRRTDNIEERK